MTTARKPSRPGVVGTLLILAVVGALLVAATLIEAPLARAAGARAQTAGAKAKAAQTSVGEEVIERCTHGESVAGFTLPEYREALQIATSGPNASELEEYSSCVGIIKRAEREAALQGGPGSSAEEGAPGAAGTGPTTPPPGSEGAGAARALPVSEGEEREIDAAVNGGGSPVDLGGRVVHPGVVDTHTTAALAALPTPLKVVLAFIVAGALATLGYRLRNLVPVPSGRSRGGSTDGGARRGDRSDTDGPAER